MNSKTGRSLEGSVCVCVCVRVTHCLWAHSAAPAGWWRRCTSWRPSRSDRASGSWGVGSFWSSAVKRETTHGHQSGIKHTTLPEIQYGQDSYSDKKKKKKKINACPPPQGGTVVSHKSSCWSSSNILTAEIQDIQSQPSVSSSIKAGRLKKTTDLFLPWRVCVLNKSVLQPTDRQTDRPSLAAVKAALAKQKKKKPKQVGSVEDKTLMWE